MCKGTRQSPRVCTVDDTIRDPLETVKSNANPREKTEQKRAKEGTRAMRKSLVGNTYTTKEEGRVDF